MLEAEAAELQRQMARVDLQTERSPRPAPDFIEFLVLKIKNLKIKIYQEPGHKTPHLHIDYAREHHIASYAIVDGQRLAGSLDSKYDRQIVAWISEHRDRLLDVWTAAQSGNDPHKLIADLAGDA